MSENVGEIIYSLDQKDSPQAEDSESLFSQFFTKFEEMSGSLHINTFGVTATTLEDVFLKILYLSNPDRAVGKQLPEEVKNDALVNLFMDKKLVRTTKGEFELFFQKFKELIIKRLHHSKRYYPTLIFQLIIPFTIFFLIFTLDTYLRPDLQKKHELHLNLYRLYGRTKGFFKDNMDDPNFFQSYNRTAANSHMEIDHPRWNQDVNDFIANKSKKDTLSKFSRNQLFGTVLRQVKDNSTSNDTILNLDLEIWFNNEASHSLPLAVSTAYNSLFEYVNDLSVNDYHEVHFINQPFPNPVALVHSFRIIRVNFFRFSS